MTKPTISVAYATSSGLQPDALQSLAADELERADTFRLSARRDQFLTSRTLLRALLANHTGRQARSFRFATDGRGKPGCVDGPAISISHSRDIVACAVADAGQVGIDIEFPDRPHDTATIAERYFSADEARWLAGEPVDRFYMLWVLKEAWLKALGLGLAGGLDKLQCTVRPPNIEAQASGGALGSLALHAFGDGWLGIASTAALAIDPQIREWHPATGRFVDAADIERVAAYP